MGVAIQIAGSLLVLAGFICCQLGWMEAKSKNFLVLNLLGSGILSVDAFIGKQWGFLLLEGVWAAVSLGAFVRLVMAGMLVPRVNSPDE
jgi:hypothetical protein